MIGCTRRPDKRGGVRFAEPPWDERSEKWQERDDEVPADHVARAVVESMKQLDLTPLYDSYLGVGSPPIRPDLMLAIALTEVQLGHSRPSQWFRNTVENQVLQWVGFGIRPSRSSWYNFADRIAPFLDEWNATVLENARRQEVTKAERIALDGTAVAASASRHRLLNEAKVQERLTELEQACQADAKGRPPEETPKWMANTPVTRDQQRERYQHALRRLVELHAVNDRQDRRRRRKREKIVVSASEPEAALGRDKYNVFRPLYNVQLVRDLDSHLYLAGGGAGCRDQKRTWIRCFYQEGLGGLRSGGERSEPERSKPPKPAEIQDRGCRPRAHTFFANHPSFLSQYVPSRPVDLGRRTVVE